MTLIRQTSINEAAKMDFGNGIRSLMRQDPDVILVGEIRDEDTATMAFRAAMTGHQVYSTRTPIRRPARSPGSRHRPSFRTSFAGNIIASSRSAWSADCASTASRLTRRAPASAAWVGARADRPPTLYRAVGCDQCEYQGYRGRMAIIEILKMDGELDELIAHRATGRELQKSALARGFRTLADDGVRRVLDGSTALDELMRVVDSPTGCKARRRTARQRIKHGTLCLKAIDTRERRCSARSKRSIWSTSSCAEAHGAGLGAGRTDPSRRSLLRSGEIKRAELINFCFTWRSSSEPGCRSSNR